jgi:hypothetical protein
MAKNWQYGRWRIVALQGVMWLVFAASLGVAALIDHRRTAALDVTLGEPRTFGRLVVRLPKGWALEGEAGPPRAVVAKDYDRQGRLRRTLRITQEVQTGRGLGPESYLESIIQLPGIEQIPDVEPFPFLGQDDGALVAFMLADSGESRRRRTRLANAGLFACTVLPDGLSVTLQLYGQGAYGPTSRGLVRLVADNMKLADAPSDRGGRAE